MPASVVNLSGILSLDGSRRVEFVESVVFVSSDRFVDSELLSGTSSSMDTKQQNGARDVKEAGTSTMTAVASTTMMEEMSSNSIGERLISVRAQVMTWDDRYCGWLPLDGGGLSTITLYQRVINGSAMLFEAIGGQSQPDQSVHMPSTSKFEYIVRGERVDDKKVTLYSHLNKDVSYRQVMPTFHHWQVEERKFGLKFMSSYEACKFHNRLQKAIEHLYRQSKSSSGDSNVETDELEDDVFVPVELPLSRAESWESGTTSRSVPLGVTASSAAGTSANPATCLLRTTFPSYSTATVPVMVHQTRSSTLESKLKKSAAAAATAATSDTIPAGRPPDRTKTWPKRPAELPSMSASTSGHAPGSAPYVYFQKEPCARATAYTKLSQRSAAANKANLQPSASFGQLTAYPSRLVAVGRSSSPLEKRASVSSLKLSLVHQQLTLPPPTSTSGGGGGSYLFGGGGRKTTKTGIGTGTSPMELLRRERCFYCKTYYIERDNRRGACPDAPDPVSKWLRRLTCLCCAECVLYCCCRDWSDGEAPREADVCSCSPADPMRRKRWTLLAVLSIFVPCLFCYPPLAACHRFCRRRFRSLGGKHTPTGPAGSRHPPAASTTGRSSSVSRKSMTPEPSSVYK